MTKKKKTKSANLLHVEEGKRELVVINPKVSKERLNQRYKKESCVDQYLSSKFEESHSQTSEEPPMNKDYWCILLNKPKEKKKSNNGQAQVQTPSQLKENLMNRNGKCLNRESNISSKSMKSLNSRAQDRSRPNKSKTPRIKKKIVNKKDMQVISKEIIEKAPLKNNLSSNELQYNLNFFKTEQLNSSQFKKKDKKSATKLKVKKKTTT